MGEKKVQGRFTIQFNHSDPQQREVSAYLETQGRHKTQFITNAVLHYLNCEKASSLGVASLQSDSAAGAYLMKVLAKAATLVAENGENETSLRQTDANFASPGKDLQPCTEETDYSKLFETMDKLEKI